MKVNLNSSFFPSLSIGGKLETTLLNVSEEVMLNWLLGWMVDTYTPGKETRLDSNKPAHVNASLICEFSRNYRLM